MTSGTEMLTGVLLAAGAGRRFGMPKVLAEGGRWAALAVAALRDGGCERVLVVLGAAPDATVPGAEPVLATDWSIGLSRSIAAGLRRADGDVVVTVVDTPDVDAACVRRVVAAGRTAPSGVARAVYRGGPGHPVFIAARRRDELTARLAAATATELDRGLGPHLPVDTTAVDCSDLATGLDIDLDPGAGTRTGSDGWRSA
jgi:CTP:molybdopterin cytidylyltransferase MocA